MIALPPYARGLKIGLLGGSFNPPHRAHLAISVFAMKRLGLDRVWWLVTPGNPLKDTRLLRPLPERLAAARRVAGHPRIAVSGFEAAIGTRYTFDTLTWLAQRAPQARFVWIMGADNLARFHRWQRWRAIAASMPMAVVDRYGNSLGALASPAATALAPYRLPESAARRLPYCRPPAWVFLHGLKSPLSSTALRVETVNRE